jgi:hypothetical protein
MNNISTQDYILWNTKQGCPAESLDTVYHHTTLVDLINDGFTFPFKEYEQFINVALLPISWQELISDAIEKTKESNLES